MNISQCCTKSRSVAHLSQNIMALHFTFQPKASIHAGRQPAGAEKGLKSGELGLGSRARAQPGVDASRSELAALEIEREATELTLETTLAMATDIYQSAARSQQQWQEKVLPLLDQASRAAASAYEVGATSALEWHTIQTELIDGQLAALEEGLRGQRALIEIERLLGRAATGPILSGSSNGSSPSNLSRPSIPSSPLEHQQ